MFNKRESKRPDVEFLDTTRKAYQYHPIQLAKNTPAHFRNEQLEAFGTQKFSVCPGMMDLKNYGYLMTAWDDINIIADKGGTLMFLGGGPGGKREPEFHSPKLMDAGLALGVFKPEGIPLEVFHIGSPWSISVNNPKISAMVLPPYFHSRFLDDIYIYPGIVDYGNFTSINLICSPKRACKLTIKAGEPLLQILPFEGKEISAGYGPADDYDKDRHDSAFSTAKQFYRKYIQINKKATIEEL